MYLLCALSEQYQYLFTHSCALCMVQSVLTMSKIYHLTHRATVTKLPDAKPLQLIGCFSLGTKKSLAGLAEAKLHWSSLLVHMLECK